MFTSNGTLRQMFICLRPSPLLGYWLGWSRDFLDVESGQIQNVKLLQNMISNRTQRPPPPPSHTLPVQYVLDFDFGKGGGVGEVNQRED